MCTVLYGLECLNLVLKKKRIFQAGKKAHVGGKKFDFGISQKLRAIEKNGFISEISTSFPIGISYYQSRNTLKGFLFVDQCCY